MRLESLLQKLFKFLSNKKNYRNIIIVLILLLIIFMFFGNYNLITERFKGMTQSGSLQEQMNDMMSNKDTAIAKKKHYKKVREHYNSKNTLKESNTNMCTQTQYSDLGVGRNKGNIMVNRQCNLLMGMMEKNTNLK